MVISAAIETGFEFLTLRNTDGIVGRRGRLTPSLLLIREGFSAGYEQTSREARQRKTPRRGYIVRSRRRMWGRVLEVAIADTARLLIIAVASAESMHAKTRLLGPSFIRGYTAVFTYEGEVLADSGVEGVVAQLCIARRTFQSASSHSCAYIDLADEQAEPHASFFVPFCCTSLCRVTGAACMPFSPGPMLVLIVASSRGWAGCQVRNAVRKKF